ncbi:MAG: VOC family protein [Akkermansiaceae bacterium]|nr:VOC family protein [Akkermansiaceae bacterium]NNM28177.1 VOC family protein [Akkermansiaceae bacterium]
MSADGKVGTIGWRDLTVADAEEVAEFYKEVVGWKLESTSMGDYEDYCVSPPGGGGPVAGICHARGSNANLPPQWLVYITVSDVDAGARKCVELGGRIIDGPRPMGDGRICVIRDPAGAVAALYQE